MYTNPILWFLFFWEGGCLLVLFFCFEGLTSASRETGRQAAGICCNSIVVSRDWPLAGLRPASSRIILTAAWATGDTSLHFLKVISMLGTRGSVAFAPMSCFMWQPRRHIREGFNARANVCATAEWST